MNRKIAAFLLLMLQVQSVWALDNSKGVDPDLEFYKNAELVKYIENAHKTVYKHLKPVPLCESDFTQKFKGTCPAYILNAVKDNYKGGAVGVIDKAMNDGEFSTPDKICGRITPPYTPSTFMKELNASSYASTAPLHLSANAEACMNSLQSVKWDKGERQRAHQYALAKMLYDNERLISGFKNMLESKHQLDLVLGKSEREECFNYPHREVVGFCQSLQGCKPSGSNKMDEKVNELGEALQTIRALDSELTHLKNENGDPKKIMNLEKGIEGIKSIYPILGNSDFKPLMRKAIYTGNKITNAEIKTALTSDLSKVRKKVDVQLKQLKLANTCMNSTENKCSGIEELLNETAPGWADVNELPYEPYYSCIEKTKSRRDSDNKMLANAAIVASMAILPMGAVGIAGSLYKAGKLIKTTTHLTQLNKTVDIAATIGDITLTEIEAAKIYKACKAKLKTLTDYQSMKPTCELIENKVSLATDVNQCHQQIIAGALSTVLSGVGLGMMKYHSSAVATAATDNVNNLIKGSDPELYSFFDDIAANIKSPEDRVKMINELNARLSTIAKSKEYSPEEIKAAMKVFLKKCGK